MGKKLDFLLRKNNFKTYKFKPQVNLAISRLAVLKNQRQVKCSQARSDVVQFLQQGFQERALLRVEHVMKEQNMLDAFGMMEGYCNLLIERVHLVEQENIERHTVEQQLFGCEIRNIVAVGGPKRTGEVKVERWGEELKRVGFRPVPLSGNPADIKLK